MKNKKPDEPPKPATEKPAEEEKEEGEIQSKVFSITTYVEFYFDSKSYHFLIRGDRVQTRSVSLLRYRG
jgi:hypothetical protein